GVVNPTAKLQIGGTPGVDGIRLPDGTLLTSTSVFAGGWTNPPANLALSGSLAVGADAIPIQETAFGFSPSYKVLRLGLDQSARSLALNVDPMTVAGGSFGGSGDILIGNASILAPNASRSNWMGVIRAAGGSVYMGGNLVSGAMDGSGLV